MPGTKSIGFILGLTFATNAETLHVPIKRVPGNTRCACRALSIPIAAPLQKSDQECRVSAIPRQMLQSIIIGLVIVTGETYSLRRRDSKPDAAFILATALCLFLEDAEMRERIIVG
jgi:hypothetical protein